MLWFFLSKPARRSQYTCTWCWKSVTRPGTVHLAFWVNTIIAEWNVSQMSEHSTVCYPLLCICFMQLVSPGLIISRIRSSNSDSPRAAQWTYCSLGSWRDAQTECVCVLGGGFPQFSLDKFVFWHLQEQHLDTTTFPLGTQSDRTVCLFVCAGRVVLPSTTAERAVFWRYAENVVTPTGDRKLITASEVGGRERCKRHFSKNQSCLLSKMTVSATMNLLCQSRKRSLHY